MTGIKSILIACLIFTAGLIVCCNLKPATPTIDLTQIYKLDSGSIKYEEKNGVIVVSITDILNESDTYILKYENASREDALIILRSTQLKLERKSQPTP